MTDPYDEQGGYVLFIKAIPSVLTIANLILGLAAMMLSFDGFMSDAALLVVIGMALDGLDGRVARWLHAESEFGKELDSLSDIVTFGVAPAFIMYKTVLSGIGFAGILIAILFPVCGALRLARFNVQKTTSRYFIGLPITAAGGVLATMALYRNLLSSSAFVLPSAMVLLSLLMVSQVRYPNFKKVRFPRSAIVVVPLLAVFVLFIFRYQRAMVNRLIFVPLAVYALYGVWRMIQKRSKRHEAASDEVAKGRGDL